MTSVHSLEKSLADKISQAVKTSCHPVMTQAPYPSIIRAQGGKFYNVCSWFNNTSYREIPTKIRKQRQQAKKIWVPNKTFSEPTKMKQVWVPKSTSPKLETKSVIGDRKKHWNQKSLGNKKRVLKSQIGCSTSYQKFSGVRYVSKPIIKWVPKCF